MSTRKAKIAVYFGLFLSFLLVSQSVRTIFSFWQHSSFSDLEASSLIHLAGGLAGTILGGLLMSILGQIKNNLPSGLPTPPLPGNYRRLDSRKLSYELQRQATSFNDSLRALVMSSEATHYSRPEYHIFIRNDPVDRDAMSRSLALLKAQAPDDYFPRFRISSPSPIWTRNQANEVLIPIEIMGQTVFQKWIHRENQWELDSIQFLKNLQEDFGSNFA